MDWGLLFTVLGLLSGSLGAFVVGLLTLSMLTFHDRWL